MAFEGVSFFQTCRNLSEMDMAEDVRLILLSASRPPSQAPSGCPKVAARRNRVEVLKDTGPDPGPGPSRPCPWAGIWAGKGWGCQGCTGAGEQGGGSQAEAGVLITVQLY